MSGIPGMDRAAMEKERLARVAARNGNNASKVTKRDRSISPPELSRPTKIQKIQTTTNVLKSEESPKAQEDERKTTQGLYKAATQQTGASNHLQYPNGIVKRTWAFQHPRSNDIKIEEVLEKSTLRTALLSSFMFDVPWIMSKIDLQRTKLIFAMHAQDEATKQQYLQETEYMRKVLRLSFPPLTGDVKTMHSKLMLLFHPHKLRIAVPSANLTNFDWGETGVMENTVFIIDLPRLEKSETRDFSTLTAFGQELRYFITCMGCDKDVQDSLLKFDFSATKDLAFVHSVGGDSYGSDMERTGMAGLSKAVRELDLITTQDLKIDFASSSIGHLDNDYLSMLHITARGDHVTAKQRPKNFFQPRPVTTNIRERFHIYFPTHQTVANSTGGTDSGGTICMQSKWWDQSQKLPRSCFRDYRSTRPGLLSHNKIMYARGQSEAGQQIAWAYVGSANFSESAWGKAILDRKRKEWKIKCRNWECGVLIPVLRPASEEKQAFPLVDAKTKGEIENKKANAKSRQISEDAETESEDEGEKTRGKSKLPIPPEDVETESEDEGETRMKTQVGMDVFKDIVDVPFEYPAAEYGSEKPWCFM